MSYLSFVCAVEQAWYKYVCVFSLFKRRGKMMKKTFFSPRSFSGREGGRDLYTVFFFFLNFF